MAPRTSDGMPSSSAGGVLAVSVSVSVSGAHWRLLGWDVDVDILTGAAHALLLLRWRWRKRLTPKVLYDGVEGRERRQAMAVQRTTK